MKHRNLFIVSHSGEAHFWLCVDVDAHFCTRNQNIFVLEIHTFSEIVGSIVWLFEVDVTVAAALVTAIIVRWHMLVQN